MSEPVQRWTAASVYPDMWADPEHDPRNNVGSSPEGEVATLLDYLANYRMTLAMKCEGLDAGQLARRSVPPSSMSLIGLLHHLAEVERDWRGKFMPGDPPAKLYGPGDGDFQGAAGDAWTEQPGDDDGAGFGGQVLPLVAGGDDPCEISAASAVRSPAGGHLDGAHKLGGAPLVQPPVEPALLAVGGVADDLAGVAVPQLVGASGAPARVAAQGGVGEGDGCLVGVLEAQWFEEEPRGLQLGR
ncbi:DUF664 domain-containing protein [Pseudokineococcus sp. 1T1Z-3]|uniref:mycothiol transferase n=1 Tax=Pseudokineococcus sp. 1T1Z-3 TaxID=3132745 RepID=UPI0030A73172